MAGLRGRRQDTDKSEKCYGEKFTYAVRRINLMGKGGFEKRPPW